MVTITSPLHMNRTSKALLFYSLFINYAPGVIPFNYELNHSEFITELQLRYDCISNEQNKAFLQSAEHCNFLSVTRQIDDFQINF